MPDLPDMEMIEKTIFQLLENCKTGRTLNPGEVARALMGKDEKLWRLAMKPIKEKAIELAKKDQLKIIRKGKEADLKALKGLYRLKRKEQDYQG